jgi:hypothetical protein
MKILLFFPISVIALLAWLYCRVIRPWHLGWGASAAEVQQSWPGDDLVPRPKLQSTHAITIQAGAARVWPWIVQLGQGRGGFYSYDWLENLFRLDIHSADRLIPEFQHLEVGDLVRLAPQAGIPVALIEPGRSLVLFGQPEPNTGLATGSPSPRPGADFAYSWAFILNELDESTTRLVVRSRGDWKPGLLMTLACRVFLEPASFIMERKMLLGLKGRVEAHTGH